MGKMKLNWLVVVVLLLLGGCTLHIVSFETGIGEMQRIDKKYGVDIRSMPATMGDAVLMRKDLLELRGRSATAPESFKLFLDYRIKSLESNIVSLEAWKHGNKATTRNGFGCKSLPIVLNSSVLRNFSAQKGYDAIKALQEFVDKYPEEALSINITQRDVVFSNLFYYKVEKEAARDRRVIEYFCGNKTKKEGG
jgi:hypothetical protein